MHRSVLPKKVPASPGCECCSIVIVTNQKFTTRYGTSQVLTSHAQPKEAASCTGRRHTRAQARSVTHADRDAAELRWRLPGCSSQVDQNAQTLRRTEEPQRR
jgi:hypothetical protein